MTKRLKSYMSSLDENLKDLEMKFGVKKIAIFGSTARGEDMKDSDIDVIVEFKKPIGFFAFVELENYLSKMLGKKVDLTTKKALKSTIKKEVLKEAAYA